MNLQLEENTFYTRIIPIKRRKTFFVIKKTMIHKLLILYTTDERVYELEVVIKEYDRKNL